MLKPRLETVYWMLQLDLYRLFLTVIMNGQPCSSSCRNDAIGVSYTDNPYHAQSYKCRSTYLKSDMEPSEVVSTASVANDSTL